jgi:group I intron endonuclease
MKKSGIYCIENLINHKKYIGQSNNIEYRWKQHKYELNRGCHDNDYLQKAWNKYGCDNFNFYIIELCDIEMLNELEVYYIDFYDTLNRDNGYNLTSGGGANKYYSKEVCEKISRALVGHEVSLETRIKLSEHHADVSGENHPMFGRKHSDEAIEKMRQAGIGRPSSRKILTPVLCIELNTVFENATDAGKKLNLDSSAILKCCRGERKTCGGYRWDFV